MRFDPLPLAVLALAPSAAFAVDYLNAEQAERAIFPEAERFEPAAIQLDAAAMQRLSEQGVRARSARWPLRVARKGGAVLGYVVVDDVVGKFELITYAVGLSPEGAVKQIEVMSYRESHGHEIRSAAWRRQFAGKTAASPLRVGEDIANLSGATLSSQHVTDGVRRIVAVLDLARHSGGLP